LQAKFLRVLEDGSFQRLGSPRSLHADVRVVAATNRELDAEMAAGRLRRDLFYRLNVFPIRVPALRERREDIPLLADSIARRLARGLGRSFRAFDSGSMTRMLEYPWPGNVRELANVVERSLILCRSEEITVETGMLETGAPAPGARDDADDGSPRRERTLRAIERRHILSVMADCSWRVRGHGGAAEILDVVPTTLESLMHRLGIKRPG
jgi:DNA-binding NtrC family response regulator